MRERHSTKVIDLKRKKHGVEVKVYPSTRKGGSSYDVENENFRQKKAYTQGCRSNKHTMRKLE